MYRLSGRIVDKIRSPALGLLSTSATTGSPAEWQHFDLGTLAWHDFPVPVAGGGELEPSTKAQVPSRKTRGRTSV